MEGQTVTLQDIYLFDYGAGVDHTGRFLGHTVPTGVRPAFTDRFEDLGIQAVCDRVPAPPTCGGRGDDRHHLAVDRRRRARARRRAPASG